MYWQKRFDSENLDKDIEEKIKNVFGDHDGTYGYRRITATLRNCGIVVNQKKVRRIMNKLGLKCIAFSNKSRKYNLYRGTIGEILSFTISERPNFKSISDALNKAINITNNCPYRRTFHSDQGCSYQMKKYTKTLKQNKIFQSMSRKGTCLDNSPMENFF